MIRVAPLSDLSTSIVHEHELDIIAAGWQATLALNLAVALISIGGCLVLILTTITIESDRLFCGYLTACLNCLIAGTVMFPFELKARNSVNQTITKIKERLVVSRPMQE